MKTLVGDPGIRVLPRNRGALQKRKPLRKKGQREDEENQIPEENGPGAIFQLDPGILQAFENRKPVTQISPRENFVRVCLRFEAF